VRPFAGPVDAVYTWVNGADLAWQERFCRTRVAVSRGDVIPDMHPTAASRSRYADHDELRYSLRSLEMYAPWVRHVFLVTDQQVPAWLVEAHPRLTVIDHRDILPDRYLPTFNSHAIETALHLIPGLAEHFIYFNDDVLLGARVTPGHFFTPDGKTRVFPSPKAIDGDLPVMQAARQNAALLEELVGMTVTHRYRHTPHPQRVSISRRLEALIPAEIAETRSHPFRSPSDISFASSLVLSYACAIDEAAPSGLSYEYIDVGRLAAVPRLLRLARGFKTAFVCINQVGKIGPFVGLILPWVLRKRWDVTSSFERGTSPRMKKREELS